MGDQVMEYMEKAYIMWGEGMLLSRDWRILGLYCRGHPGGTG